MSAIYVYAIAPAAASWPLDVGGVDDDGAVYIMTYQRLVAVVSASPITDYRGLRRDQAARYLVAHQRVVEAVMAVSAVLPVKFGTILPDEATVQRCLAQGAALFDAALTQMAGRVQMEAVVLWPLQEIFQEIAAEPDVAQLRDELAADPGAATVTARTALGRLVQGKLAQRRADLRDCLLPALCEEALDVVANPLLDDSMVANVALLLDGAGRQALDEQVEQLDAQFGGRLTFRCIGPLPPYSFASVELESMPFETVDGARKRLGLGARRPSRRSVAPITTWLARYTRTISGGAGGGR
jgi:hypothetical protein